MYNCFGDTVTYQYKILNNLKVKYQEWTVNSFLKSNDFKFKYIYPDTGRYYLELKLVSENNCSSGFKALIIVNEKPKAAFSFKRMIENNDGIPYQFFNECKKSNQFVWRFSGFDTSHLMNPSYTYSDTGIKKIILIASNNNICFDTAVQLIPVFNRLAFYFPNAFSPNGNGFNDDFGLNPNQSAFVKRYHLEIYNRWGAKIFETNDVYDHWTGNVMQGVYLFKVLITDIYNLQQEISGAVEVLK